MKPVIYNDVLAAVSVVASVPRSQRDTAMTQLLAEAEIADWYRLCHRAAHPVFGDGSLLTAALRHDLRSDVSFDSEGGLHAWICVLTALSHRLGQPDAQLIQRVAVGSSSRRFGAMSSPQASQ